MLTLESWCIPVVGGGVLAQELSLNAKFTFIQKCVVCAKEYKAGGGLQIVGPGNIKDLAVQC